MSQRRASRTDRAHRYLADEIARGRWQAGDVLSTYALAEELGISRTPVLEALRRLQHDGIVEIIPQVGCRIVPPSAGALTDLFATRAALEGAAAGAAALRIDADGLAALDVLLSRLGEAASESDRAGYAQLDERFHVAVLEAGGMPRLAEAGRATWASLREQLLRLPVGDEDLAASEAEHRELFEALCRGSAARARTAAERHANLSAARFAAGLVAPDDPLAHRALVYRSEAEFLAAAVPFVRAGLDAGERILAVTTDHNAAALAAELGRSADEVEFRDSHDWYVLPSHTLLSYQRYVEDADRGRVRVIGEGAWNGDSTAPMDEWIRYESLLNVAFAQQPATIMCPYDAGALPDRIVAHARRTHREVCVGAAVEPSAEYTPVVPFLRELDAQGFAAPPARAAELPIGRDLRSVRSFILDRAAEAGIRGKRMQDAFLAVQEVARSVVGARGDAGRLRAWTEPGELIYEVSDDGAGIGDPLAGSLPSDPAQVGEPRGLWMARLLCDLVEARTHERGIVVRLHVATPPR